MICFHMVKKEGGHHWTYSQRPSWCIHHNAHSITLHPVKNGRWGLGDAIKKIERGIEPEQGKVPNRNNQQTPEDLGAAPKKEKEGKYTGRGQGEGVEWDGVRLGGEAGSMGGQSPSLDGMAKSR